MVKFKEINRKEWEEMSARSSGMLKSAQERDIKMFEAGLTEEDYYDTECFNKIFDNIWQGKECV
jgi:hypothetical protein